MYSLYHKHSNFGYHTLLTSDALVADIPKEEKAGPAIPPGGDMY